MQVMLGFIHLGSTLLLLQLLLNSWNPDSFWSRFYLRGIQYGEIMSAIYLKLSLSQVFSLILTRSSDDLILRLWPMGKGVILGAIGVLISSSILALFFPRVKPEGIEVMGLISNPSVFGFVWIYSLLILLIHVTVQSVVPHAIVSFRCCQKTVSMLEEQPASSKLECKGDDQWASIGKVDEEINVQCGDIQITTKGCDEEEMDAQISVGDRAGILSGRLLIEKYIRDKRTSPCSFPFEYVRALTNMFNSDLIASEGGCGILYRAMDHVARVNFLIQELYTKIEEDQLKVSERKF
jgi:hypothetical protein